VERMVPLLVGPEISSAGEREVFLRLPTSKQSRLRRTGAALAAPRPLQLFSPSLTTAFVLKRWASYLGQLPHPQRFRDYD
jgi:hypothetical protein